MQKMKMWKSTEQPEAKWAIRWKVSKDKDKGRKKDRKGKEELYSERKQCKTCRQWKQIKEHTLVRTKSKFS